MKLALIQHPCTPSIDDNRSRIAAAIADVAARGAELVVLQELPIFQRHSITIAVAFRLR